MKGLRSQPGHMSRKHSDGVNEYINQLEAEKKDLIEVMQNGLDCIDYMNELTAVGSGNVEYYSNIVMNSKTELQKAINKLKQ